MADRENPGGFARYFTLAEAAALLPEVRQRLERIRSLRVALRELGGTLEQKAQGNGDTSPSQRRFVELVAELERAIGDLHEQGIILRDPDAGLIDFPSVREGNAIFLCYRLDEDRIAFWHSMDEGFTGRKPL